MVPLATLVEMAQQELMAPPETLVQMERQVAME
jgi:hypothetical protein